MLFGREFQVLKKVVPLGRIAYFIDFSTISARPNRLDMEVQKAGKANKHILTKTFQLYKLVAKSMKY